MRNKLTNANRLFWALNGKLTEEGIRSRIRDFKKKGFGGFFLHARGGLKTEYWGEEWFHALAWGIDEAEKCGLEAWLYDEDGWPSGFAGGRVNGKGSDYCQKFLIVSGNCKGSVFQAFPSGQVNENNFVVGFNRGVPKSVPSGSRYRSLHSLEYCRSDCGSAEILIGYKLNPHYVDIFNPLATDAFVSIVYEEYKRRFGDRFGGTIKGIFSDEPQYGKYCYSEYINKRFKEKFGYDLLDFIYLLNMPGEAGNVFRQDFYEVVCELYKDNYVEKINQWCRENGLLFTGHFPEEDGISTQYFKGGNIMLNYTAIDFPGIDFLGKRLTSPVLLKQISSAQNQLGKNEVLSESFGCCGWNTSFADYLRIWGYESVNGINNACLHLSAYSIAGVRKRDYPAFFSSQNNWWESVSYLNDAMKNMNDFSSLGKSENDVLVLSPVFGCYSEVASSDEAGRISTQFRNLTENLLSIQIGYDIAEETYLKTIGYECKNGEICVGCGRYRYLIVADAPNIRSETAVLIKKAVENGVTVAFCGGIMQKADGISSTTMSQLSSALRDRKFNVVQNRRELWQKYFKYIGYERKAAFFSEREQAIVRDLIIRTTSDEANRYISVYNGSFSQEYRGILKIEGSGDVFAYNVLTGKEELVPSYTDGKQTFCEIGVTEGSLSAFRLCFGRISDQCGLRLIHKKRLVATESKLMSQNAFTIDFAELMIDGKSFGKDYVLNIQSTAYEYSLRAEKPFEMVVRYEFFVDREIKDLSLCVETATCERVELNGKAISFGEAFYMDESIRVASIEANLVEGRNVVSVYYNGKPRRSEFELETVFETEKNRFSYSEEIENIYLLGDFDVTPTGNVTRLPWYIKVANDGFLLKKATGKKFDCELTDQGLWFYRGDVRRTYEYVYRDGTVKLSIDDFKGALCTVEINGNEIGCIVGKEELDITDFLKIGFNIVSVALRGTNRNLLGPHHHYEGERNFVGVNTFKGTRGYEDEVLNIDPPTNTFMSDYAFVRFSFGNVFISEYEKTSMK